MAKLANRLAGNNVLLALFSISIFCREKVRKGSLFFAMDEVFENRSGSSIKFPEYLMIRRSQRCFLQYSFNISRYRVREYRHTPNETVFNVYLTY
jgi:hypothetical protein